VPLKIAVLKETAPGEKRVAISLDTLKKYTAQGIEITVQSGAGDDAALSDAMLKDAGAKITKSTADTLKNVDVLVCIQAPEASILKLCKAGTLIVGSFAPHSNQDKIKTYADLKLCAMAMDFMPRITRAQSMDILSSQSNLAGYKSVLDACEHYPRALPMMMTAAGTIPPARVFVMGAGVAGLQAAATARRLGAIVTATDVRPATK
jgi:NAD(P) transhydrogenase subunit alpha